MAILRTFENKPGVVFDAERTEVIFAEDMNDAGEALDNHDERIVDLEEGGGGGGGYALQMSAPNESLLVDGQTVYWGPEQLSSSIASGAYRLYIPKAGTIRRVYVRMLAGTAGSNENWSTYIFKNGSTSHLIQTLGTSNVERVWTASDLALAVSEGDYICIKEVQPTWGTNPANVVRDCVLYIETA